LLQATTTSHDRIHLEEIVTIESDPMDKAHQRPSLLRGTGGRFAASGKYASFSKEEEEALRRFVHKVLAWVEREIDARGIDRLHVIAPSRFRGSLLQEAPRRILERMTSAAGELINLDPGALARHPAIARCVSEPMNP
jgi:hypothetical protein